MLFTVPFSLTAHPKPPISPLESLVVSRQGNKLTPKATVLRRRAAATCPKGLSKATDKRRSSLSGFSGSD